MISFNVQPCLNNFYLAIIPILFVSIYEIISESMQLLRKKGIVKCSFRSLYIQKHWQEYSLTEI